MARISLDPPKSLAYRLGSWYSRRSYGAVLEPARAMAHHPRLLKTNARSELSLRRWDRVPTELKHLAVMSAAVTVGCVWCVDFGYWVGITEGMDAQKIRDVARWRDSAAYTDLERKVLGYAEAASLTPPMVTDAMVAGLAAELDEGQLVELTMMIAVENQRSRFNAALGLASQGFTERCEVRA